MPDILTQADRAMIAELEKNPLPGNWIIDPASDSDTTAICRESDTANVCIIQHPINQELKCPLEDAEWEAEFDAAGELAESICREHNSTRRLLELIAALESENRKLHRQVVCNDAGESFEVAVADCRAEAAEQQAAAKPQTIRERLTEDELEEFRQFLSYRADKDGFIEGNVLTLVKLSLALWRLIADEETP
jgi:hypothetical protein